MAVIVGGNQLSLKHHGAEKQKGQLATSWPECLNLLVGAAGFEDATTPSIRKA